MIKEERSIKTSTETMPSRHQKGCHDQNDNYHGGFVGFPRFLFFLVLWFSSIFCVCVMVSCVFLFSLIGADFIVFSVDFMRLRAFIGDSNNTRSHILGQ